jgi:hypothetical protein
MIAIVIRALVHRLAPALHVWSEMTDKLNRGPIAWYCRTCGATRDELPP